MAVRLFVGNLAYSTTEADLRTYFGTVAPPSQVVLPVDRETGRPRGLRLRRVHRSRPCRAGHPALQRPALQWTPAGRQRGARPRRSRPGGPPRPGGYSSGPRPGGGFAPRPPGSFGSPRPFDGGGSAPGGAPARSRNFGPDAKPQRGGSAKSKKKGEDKPRGPIPLKNTGRSFSLDDVDSPDEALPDDLDDIATSKPRKRRRRRIVDGSGSMVDGHGRWPSAIGHRLSAISFQPSAQFAYRRTESTRSGACHFVCPASGGPSRGACGGPSVPKEARPDTA